MEKTVGYAVVGLGVGRNHVTAAADAKGGKLVAVCDLRQDRLDRMVNILKERGTYPEDLKLYSDFDEMLKDPEIDVVSVCTPSGTHAELAIRALNAGKHVLIEKPMDIEVERILEIEKARVRTGLKVGGIFQNRRNAVMEPVKKAVENGDLGEIFTGFFRVNWHRTDEYFLESGGWRGTWAMDGGGSLMNQGVHTVDIMQWLLGDVASIRSETRIINHNIETEDFTNSVVKFKSGAIVNLVSTTCARPGFGTDIQLTGTKGSIHVDAETLIRWCICRDGATRAEIDAEEREMLAKYGAVKSTGSADPTAITLRGHAYQVQDMIDAVRFDRDPMVGPMEATKAVRIINAVYESARTGKEIFFD